jgi:SAM-dependent methyltransferase
VPGDPDSFRDAVRRGYDDLGRTYAEQTDGAAPLLQALFERLGPAARVLNAGCGPGRTAMPALVDRAAAADGGSIGLDLSRTQLDLARDENPAPGYVQGDLTALPLEVNSVDGITEYHAVIHVPSDHHLAVYREFARVLRPGGHAILTIGTAEWSGTNVNWLDAGTEMRWDIPAPETSRTQLRDAGFETLDEAHQTSSAGGDWTHLLVGLE